MRDHLPTLQALLEQNGHRLTQYNRCLQGHTYQSVFRYSEEHGGTRDSFQYYNDYVVDITNN